MSELPTLQIDPQAWVEGVRDAYTGLATRADAGIGDNYSYASGRVEGEALRLRHQREYEQLLFSGRQSRELAQDEDSRG